MVAGGWETNSETGEFRGCRLRFYKGGVAGARDTGEGMTMVCNNSYIALHRCAIPGHESGYRWVLRLDLIG